MNERKVYGASVVACCDRSEVLEFIEAALDEVAGLVRFEL